MSEALSLVYGSIDEQNADKPAATRRQLVAGAAATVGGLGLMGLVDEAEGATARAAEHRESPETILNVAATAEVLATIVNTVGGNQPESFFAGLPGDPSGAITRTNVRAAAREELIHFDVLRSLGARPATRTIYVPNAYLANATAFLTALEVGDQIFVNAYLLATTVFANRDDRRLKSGPRGRLARIASEFCGVEAVHRALARQSLGKLGNDRVFLRYSQREDAQPPIPNNPNAAGFRRISSAVAQLQRAGFGFGRQGSMPGTAFNFDTVRQQTPTGTNDLGTLPTGQQAALSTRTPR